MGNGNKVINIKLRPRLFLEEIEEANEVLQEGNLIKAQCREHQSQ